MHLLSIGLAGLSASPGGYSHTLLDSCCRCRDERAFGSWASKAQPARGSGVWFWRPLEQELKDLSICSRGL